jgi:hypothetical protein
MSVQQVTNVEQGWMEVYFEAGDHRNDELERRCRSGRRPTLLTYQRHRGNPNPNPCAKIHVSRLRVQLLV